MEVVLFFSVWMSYVWKSNFFALHGSRTSLLSVPLLFLSVVLFSSQSYFSVVLLFRFFLFFVSLFVNCRSLVSWSNGTTSAPQLENSEIESQLIHSFFPFLFIYFFYFSVFLMNILCLCHLILCICIGKPRKALKPRK